jgi:hypothetical protein
MENEEFNTSEGITDENQTPKEAGSGDVSSIAQVLGDALGKEFPDDKTALKSVQDTFKYIGSAGKMKEALEAVKSSRGVSEDEALNLIKELSNPGSNKKSDFDESKFVTKDELKSIEDERSFFQEKSELKPYAPVIKAMAKSKGISLEEAVNSEEFKPLLDGAIAHNKSEGQKSVIMSNPRITSANSKMDEAEKISSDNTRRDALGNPVGLNNPAAQGKAKEKAVGAVMDAFEIKD